MTKDIEEVKQKIFPILKSHHVKRAGLFGSFARGDISQNSDLDVLVEIEDDISLLDFVGIKLELEETLDRKVDLVEYSTIRPLLRESILSEEIAIL